MIPCSVSTNPEYTGNTQKKNLFSTLGECERTRKVVTTVKDLYKLWVDHKGDVGLKRKKTHVQHLPLPFTLKTAYVTWSGGEGRVTLNTPDRVSALAESFPSTEAS